MLGNEIVKKIMENEGVDGEIFPLARNTAQYYEYDIIDLKKRVKTATIRIACKKDGGRDIHYDITKPCSNSKNGVIHDR